MSKKIYKSLAAVVAVAGIGGSFALGVLVVVLLPQLATPQFGGITLETIRVEAKAAVLYDIRQGRVLYQKNANLELPLASITKLMTAQTLLSVLDSRQLVQITTDSLRAEGDSGLRVGDAFTLEDLLRLGLVASSNDAMAAAAASLGEEPATKMNAAAQALGLTKTRFLNPTGLDVNADTAGATGSAYDVARLASAFFRAHPALFEETMRASVSVPQGDTSLTAAATAAPLFNVPGIIGGKTGYTDLAGGNLVVAFDLEIGRPVIAVVLGSTREGRFTDIRALITAARAAY